MINFFARPQTGLEKPCYTGAIVSLSTLFIGILLIVYLALSSFDSGPAYDIQFEVSQNSSNIAIEAYMDILFTHAPCEALRLQKLDPTILQPLTIRAGILFERILPEDGSIVPERYIDPQVTTDYPNEEDTTQIILTGLKNGEQCRMRGSFLIKRGPGSFFINHELTYSYLTRAEQASPELFKKLNLAHTVVALTFGKSASGSEKRHNAAGGMIFVHHQPFTCLYYLKMIQRGEMQEKKLIEDIFQYSNHRMCTVKFIL